MSLLSIEINYSIIHVKIISSFLRSVMWGKRNKVILFRQACISLSQVLWHSMDLTSQHSHLQNELVRELERQEGKIFLISLCFLVALRNIVKYKEQGVLLTMSYLLIHFFSEELCLWHLYRKYNR